jgi:hypothetical protein
MEVWNELPESEKRAFRVPCLIVKVTEENMVEISNVLERINVELQNSISASSLSQELLNLMEVNYKSPEKAAKEITKNVNQK